jgi:hypothetical protein
MDNAARLSTGMPLKIKTNCREGEHFVSYRPPFGLHCDQCKYTIPLDDKNENTEILVND